MSMMRVWQASLGASWNSLAVYYPVVAFVVSISLLKMRAVKPPSRSKHDVLSMTGCLYFPSLTSHPALTWEQFGNLLHSYKLPRTAPLSLKIAISLQFGIHMCWIGPNGALQHFQHIEGNRFHVFEVDCRGCLVLCRWLDSMPNFIFDLNEKDIVLAYIPYFYDQSEQISIAVSDAGGNYSCKFSKSWGQSKHLIRDTEIENTTSYTPLPPNKVTQCALLFNHSLSPEVARNNASEVNSRNMSPISLPGEIPGVLSFNVVEDDDSARDEARVVDIKPYHLLNDEEKMDRKHKQATSKEKHENLKEHLFSLGYSAEEIVAVKCCLSDFVKSKHPELSSFERTDKLKNYATKEIISSLDVEKRLSAMRSTKIKKWITDH